MRIPDTRSWTLGTGRSYLGSLLLRVSLFPFPRRALDDSSAQPFFEVFGDEGVIIQVGVGPADPVNLFNLAGAEGFMRIETPDALEQALAAEHLMQAGDASGETVG